MPHLVCRLYHTSIKTLYKWLMGYEKSDKKLQSLTFYNIIRPHQSLKYKILVECLIAAS